MISDTGATSKGICSEVGGQHRRTLLRNLWKAILAGSLFLPLARSANLVDSLSIDDDDGANQFGFDAEVRTVDGEAPPDGDAELAALFFLRGSGIYVSRSLESAEGIDCFFFGADYRKVLSAPPAELSSVVSLNVVSLVQVGRQWAGQRRQQRGNTSALGCGPAQLGSG